MKGSLPCANWLKAFWSRIQFGFHLRVKFAVLCLYYSFNLPWHARRQCANAMVSALFRHPSFSVASDSASSSHIRLLQRRRLDEAGVAGVGHTHHHLHQSILISGFLLLLLYFNKEISRPRLGVSNEERPMSFKYVVLYCCCCNLSWWNGGRGKGRVVFDITFIHVLLVV